jgi:hypothetical protein
MLREAEATKILRQHHIPFKESGSEGILALLCKSEVDPERLRQLGFRISRDIGAQWVIFYKGGRIGLIV